MIVTSICRFVRPVYSSRAATVILSSPFFPPCVEPSTDGLLDVHAELLQLGHAQLSVTWSYNPRRVGLARRVLGIGNDMRSRRPGVRGDDDQLFVLGQTLLRRVVYDGREWFVKSWKMTIVMSMECGRTSCTT